MGRDVYWLSMPGAQRGTSGVIWVLDCGTIEVGLCSNQSSGISAIYRVEKKHLQALSEQLAVSFGGDIPSVTRLPEKLTTFTDVQSLADWLMKQSGVPVHRCIASHGRRATPT